MKSILLVDDEAIICTELQRTLERFEFRVETAQTVESALSRIQEAQFDAILVEFNLKSECNTQPRAGNGLQLIRRIRAFRITVPVLMFTVMEGELYEKASLDAGADEFILKTSPIPFLVSHLSAHVRGQSLGRRRRLRDEQSQVAQRSRNRTQSQLRKSVPAD